MQSGDTGTGCSFAHCPHGDDSAAFRRAGWSGRKLIKTLQQRGRLLGLAVLLVPHQVTLMGSNTCSGLLLLLLLLLLSVAGSHAPARRIQ